MTKKKHHLMLGAHVSIAGGVHHAFENGMRIGCTTIQCFTKSNRQWHTKQLLPEDIELFKSLHKQSLIDPVICHASYLINVGSPDAATAKKSCIALQQELERCNTLGIAYLVLHPGSHINTSVDECMERIAKNVSLILQKVGGNTTLLFETMAGQGSGIGYTFEQLAWLIHNTTSSGKVGICLDTCHIFAAGYDFTTPSSYKNMWATFDAIIGRKYLKVLHCNDSAKPLGSRVDRHADIGKGLIGLEGFRLIMNDSTLFDIPKIIETPKADYNDDFRNMQTLINLLSSKTKNLLNID
ncbi:MAG TPA: deoxyribonuclease IV [Candidatus Babeliales bacterium]|jgi:deoxyribonuclease-4|nr:deoxyribonuclease IV [Candidatus Babeliales bacterium]